jgi:hypothetical protein
VIWGAGKAGVLISGRGSADPRSIRAREEADRRLRGTLGADTCHRASLADAILAILVGHVVRRSLDDTASTTVLLCMASAATGHVAASPLTWLGTGQSTGEAIPITLSTSRTWNGQSSTVSALTMVDWER